MGKGINVGDKVRVTSVSLGADLTVGKVYEVLTVDNMSYPRVLDDNGKHWSLVTTAYEKVEEGTNMINDIKVGDTIRITELDPFDGNRLTLNGTYEVKKISGDGNVDVPSDLDGSNYFVYEYQYEKVSSATPRSTEWEYGELKVGDRFRYDQDGKSCECIVFKGIGSETNVKNVITDGKNPINLSIGVGGEIWLHKHDTVTKLDKYGNVIPKVFEQPITFAEAMVEIQEWRGAIARRDGKEIAVYKSTDLDKLSDIVVDFYDLAEKVQWFTQTDEGENA